MATYNIAKLHDELVTAGLPCIGVYAVDTEYVNIGINYGRSLTPSEQEQADEIIAAHDPVEYTLQPEQQLIVANGLHVAKITTSVKYADPLPKTDIIIINGIEQEIDLVDGSAIIEITSTTPGTVFALEYHGLYAVVEAK